MDISQYEIEIRKHAFERALQRDIHSDMIYSTIRGGKIKKFGKNNFKFIKKFKGFTLICVDHVVGTTIKIVTIVKK